MLPPKQPLQGPSTDLGGAGPGARWLWGRGGPAAPLTALAPSRWVQPLTVGPCGGRRWTDRPAPPWLVGAPAPASVPSGARAAGGCGEAEQRWGDWRQEGGKEGEEEGGRSGKGGERRGTAGGGRGELRREATAAAEATRWPLCTEAPDLLRSDPAGKGRPAPRCTSPRGPFKKVGEGSAGRFRAPPTPQPSRAPPGL